MPRSPSTTTCSASGQPTWAMFYPAINLAALGLPIYGYTLLASALDHVRWRATLVGSVLTLVGFIALVISLIPVLQDAELGAVCREDLDLQGLQSDSSGERRRHLPASPRDPGRRGHDVHPAGVRGLRGARPSRERLGSGRRRMKRNGTGIRPSARRARPSCHRLDSRREAARPTAERILTLADWAAWVRLSWACPRSRRGSSC